MANYRLLFRLENKGSYFVDVSEIGKLQCGHYFSQIKISNASGGLSLDKEDFNYEEMETILSKEHYERILQYNQKISELGYGLDERPEKMELGKQYADEIKDIIDLLCSEENDKLYEKTIEEEKEIVKQDIEENYYSYVSDYDINRIFDEYYDDSILDRNILGCIYNSASDYGEEIADDYGILNESSGFLRNYIDFDRLGQDSLYDNGIELENGKVIIYNQ